MAQPNYQYEKRQRDLAKKKKQEEKRLKKLSERKVEPGEEAPPAKPAEGETGPA